jgi:hypothetical protein
LSSTHGLVVSAHPTTRLASLPNLFFALIALLLIATPSARAQGAGTFTATGSMVVAGGGTETLLPNGKVLITGSGGSIFAQISNAAQIYDPATGVFSLTGNMNIGRAGQTATLLNNGKVLVQGGSVNAFPPDPAEIYDPRTSTFTETGAPKRDLWGASALL